MSAKSPAQSVLIILFGIFAFLIVIIPLFDAYILSNIAKDIGRVAKRSRLCRWYSQLRGHS